MSERESLGQISKGRALADRVMGNKHVVPGFLANGTRVLAPKRCCPCFEQNRLIRHLTRTVLVQHTAFYNSLAGDRCTRHLSLNTAR